MTTFDEATAALSLAALAWPGATAARSSAGTAELWFEVLADLPAGALLDAVRRLIDTSKHFPSVADIRLAHLEVSTSHGDPVALLTPRQLVDRFGGHVGHDGIWHAKTSGTDRTTCSVCEWHRDATESVEDQLGRILDDRQPVDPVAGARIAAAACELEQGHPLTDHQRRTLSLFGGDTRKGRDQ